MNYAFLVNKTDLLLSSGFALLWQCFELSQDSKLARDNQKSLKALTNLLMQDSLNIALEFQRICRALVITESLSPPSTQSTSITMPNFLSDRSSMPAPNSKPKSARRQLQAIASRFSSLTKPHQARAGDPTRRVTVPRVDPPYLSRRSSSQLSLSSTRSLPIFSITSPPTTRTFMDLPASTVNLDYLPLGDDLSPAYPSPSRKEAVASPGTDWSRNLGGLDDSKVNPYDGLYNGVFQDQIAQARLDLDVSTLNNPQDWLDQEWPVSAIDLSTKGLAPQSILSASEESITSGGDEFSGCGSYNDSTSCGQVDHLNIGSKTFKCITMPSFDEDAIEFDGFTPRI